MQKKIKTKKSLGKKMLFKPKKTHRKAIRSKGRNYKAKNSSFTDIYVRESEKAG